MNDAVDRLIVERQALDAGFAGGVTLSVSAHLLVAVFGIGIPMLFPTKRPEPQWNVMAVQLPGGGRGSPDASAPAPQPKKEEPPAPKPEPEKQKILKPPKEEAPRKGLPMPDEKAKKGKPTPATPQPAAGTGTSGKGSSNQTPGLGLNFPEGPGAGPGADILGDWYLAGVQRKIWQIWMQQMRSGLQQPVTVRFTIREDGSLDPNVTVLSSSGNTMLDLAAKRAVMSAQPFGPLPKNYGTAQLTIQAVFKQID